MSDHILRVTAANGMIRAFFADTRETTNEAMTIHQCTAVVAAALGRLLTASAMMGLMLKGEDDHLTLSIKGSGDVLGLLVTADSKGNVKGYPNNPHAQAEDKPNGKLNVSGIIGQGTLTVIKDMGSDDLEPYVGTIALKSGEIAEDVAYYFAQSEQTPSIVSLGVLVDTDYSIKQAGGYIIQLMPGATNELIDMLEAKMEKIENITTLYEKGYTPSTLLEYFFKDMGYSIVDEIPVKFKCDCSREKVERALISIGKSELDDLISEDGAASIKCHFCNKAYDFDEDELKRLVKEL